MRREISVLLAAALALPGLAAAAVEVEVARPPDADYSGYRSFGVRAKEGIPEDHPLGADGELFRAVSEAAVEVLLKRGLTYVEGDTPDLWVTFFGLYDEELTIEGTSRELGPVTWVGDPDAHSTRTLAHETLIVELYDAASETRVWSGWATGGARSPEKLRKVAVKMVRRVLAELPIP